MGRPIQITHCKRVSRSYEHDGQRGICPDDALPCRCGELDVSGVTPPETRIVRDGVDTTGRRRLTLWERLTGWTSQEPRQDKGCENCHKCLRGVMENGLLVTSQRMIFCPECHNKRCPKASDHNLKCTNSNEPGQNGSIY